jgi:hypothetical protein
MALTTSIKLLRFFTLIKTFILQTNPSTVNVMFASMKLSPCRVRAVNGLRNLPQLSHICTLKNKYYNY